jgi:adenosylhomocysteine nucleosidase
MISIVTALKDEVADYLAQGGFRSAARDVGTRTYLSPSKRDVVVVVGGVGRERAAAATRLTAERFAPELVISAGFAGAVEPGLKTGDLVVCDRQLSVKGPPELWSLERAQSRSLFDDAVSDVLSNIFSELGYKCTRGDCLTVPRVVSSALDKKQIGERFPVSIVDMESFWVSQMAAEYGIRHIVVKSVLDPMEQSLPSFVENLAALGGRARWVHALRYAFARPGEVPGLIRLAAQVRVAGASLTRFLRALDSVSLPAPAI